MSKIERGLSAIPDVTLARVNLTDRRVALEWKQGALDPISFIDRLAELGYKAYPFETAGAEAAEAEQSRFLLRCLGVAAFATMNVMMLSIPVWSGNVSDMIPEQRDFFHWLSALIALPAAAYAGQPFFRSAYRALRAGGVLAVWSAEASAAFTRRLRARFNEVQVLKVPVPRGEPDVVWLARM